MKGTIARMGIALTASAVLACAAGAQSTTEPARRLAVLEFSDRDGDRTHLFANLINTPPRIVCDSPVYDFGELANTDTVTHAFVIRNDGGLPLEFGKVKACCGSTANMGATIIPPGSWLCRLDGFLISADFNGSNIVFRTDHPDSPDVSISLRVPEPWRAFL